MLCVSISVIHNMDDEALNKLATQALIEEAKLGAQRAELMGPSGWLKPKQTVNKRFLHSTLHNIVVSNKHRQKKNEKLVDNYSPKELQSYSTNESIKSNKRQE